MAERLCGAKEETDLIGGSMYRRKETGRGTSDGEHLEEDENEGETNSGQTGATYVDGKDN